ncbi:hypothetical protein TNCV_1043501 [Trichonephila clavipes]|nr:hypothetical protein TNCV_1043501 [Trichonephila clavipes]
MLYLNFLRPVYIHWCAKIKDEVEKLAYQLNEEAERTERPIRRLKGGSWRRRSVTSVAAEFQCSQHRFTTLEQFQTTGTAIQGFRSEGRPRGTTPRITGTLSYRSEEAGGGQWETR